MFYFFEDPVERGDAAKTGTHGSFRDGNIRPDQQHFHVGDPFADQVFVAGYAIELLEQSGKMKSGKAGKIGEGIDGYIFRTVVVDIAADQHKLFDIVMLLERFAVGELFCAIEA